jgi:hypothetical protein
MRSPGRACAILSINPSGLVYTELFNVRGRVAMVSGTTTLESEEVVEGVKAAVKTFVDRLARDNP